MLIYWDSSAILSRLFRDIHSDDAYEWSGKEGYHLISSLAWAEVTAVMSRMRRERIITDILEDSSFKALTKGPWRRFYLCPGWQTIHTLSKKWPLQGADLWHLATAMTLKMERPEVRLLTYDRRLKEAAQREGIA